MISLINKIIEDLSDSNYKLSETLLKVQVLAHKIKSAKLKEWVFNEINGYEEEKDVPSYRIIKTVIFGNLEQDRGYGSYATRNDVQLIVRQFEEAHKIDMQKIVLKDSLSTYEYMLQQEDKFRINIPPSFYSGLSKEYSNDWKVSCMESVITSFN